MTKSGSTRWFSIRDVERLLGVKPHVIRTWEKRYRFPEPHRDQNNIRAYTVDNVMQLLDVALLLEYGHKISKVVGMGDAEKKAMLAALKGDEARQRKVTHQLFDCMFRMDTDQFEQLLDNAVMSWDINTAIEHIILPFMEIADILSYNDNSIEAHFVVTAIRRKLILGIEKLPAIKEMGRSVLLYLPQHQHFDLVLLYMNYVLRKNGVRVYYLGTDISIANLEKAIVAKQPDHICTYVANKKGVLIHEHAAMIRNNFPHLQLAVAYAAQNDAMPAAEGPKVRYFRFRNIMAQLPLAV